MNAVRDPKCITGIIKPAKLYPLKVKGTIFTLGRSTVKIYKRIVFIKKENKPSVTTFNGNEKNTKNWLKDFKK